MRAIFAVCSGLILAACVAEQPIYLVHKEGSNSAERHRQTDLCEFEAAGAIPAAMATQMSGGYYSPGSVQCSTIGSTTTCNRVGAVNIPASATTYDANAELRHRYVGRCLEAAGYAVLPKPQCRTDSERAAFFASRENQPAAHLIPCAVPR